MFFLGGIKMDVEKKELSGFPCKLNLFDFTKLPRFADSDDGKKAIKKHKLRIITGNIVKLVSWLILILGVLFLWNNRHPFWAIIVAFFGGIFLYGITIGVLTKAGANAKLRNEISHHCGAIAQYIVNNIFKEATYFYYFTDAIIYDNNICAYFSTNTGVFVIYNKNNIKDVSRERVHLGTHTTSTSNTSGTSEKTLANTLGIDPFGTRNYSGSTSTSSHSREIYEWHFDIFTDFMPYPKVSMVLPDDKFIENEIGKAYGILKP